MNAIDLLTSQHEEVADLFAQLEDAEDDADLKGDLFAQIADKLAVHAAIEEHHFYPAVKARRTKDILLESLMAIVEEEHLEIKRLLAGLLETDPDDDSFDAKIKVLQEDVEHHVEEEQNDLFPRVRQLLDEEQLEAIGQEMSGEQEELEEKGQPRKQIPYETAHAATI